MAGVAVGEEVEISVGVDVDQLGRVVFPCARPNGFVEGAANAGAVAVPVFAKNSVLTELCPTKASRSPSSSMSASAGEALVPTSASPNGLVDGAAKAGAVAVPEFAKKIVLPSSLPMKASRSPSPSMSASSTRAERPTPARPKGFVDGAPKAGASEVPVFSKWTEYP